jgi:hypothetical protein
MDPNGNIVYMILKDPKGNAASDIFKHYASPFSQSQSSFSITTTSANRKEKKKWQLQKHLTVKRSPSKN